MIKKLRQAIGAGDASTVTQLLKSGVSTEVKLTHGWTPLQVAVKGGKEKVIQALIDGGAALNAVTIQIFVLHGSFPAVLRLALFGFGDLVHDELPIPF
jgi:ankyrin repeat protein